MNEIVIGVKYSDIDDEEIGHIDETQINRSYTAQLVYTQVTTGGPTSRDSCIRWAYKKGANSVHVYPRSMIDHVPFLSEEGSQNTMSKSEIKAKLGIFEKVFEKTEVDAGIIVIADPSHYKNFGGKGAPTHQWAVENGTYEATWSMPKSWLEENEKPTTEMLKVTSGEIWVSDPCYVVRDSKWMDYLEKFDYGKKMSEGVICINTGGDGSFPVNLKLVKVKG